MRKRAVILFSPLLLFVQFGFASEYYVDPVNGDDGASGSISSPWKTVAASIGKLSPGDVLILRGGTYNEGTRIRVSNSGTPSSWITIKNYPGENPVLDGSYPEFRTPGNSAWELYDASLNIYRSINT